MSSYVSNNEHYMNYKINARKLVFGNNFSFIYNIKTMPLIILEELNEISSSWGIRTMFLMP